MGFVYGRPSVGGPTHLELIGRRNRRRAGPARGEMSASALDSSSATPRSCTAISIAKVISTCTVTLAVAAKKRWWRREKLKRPKTRSENRASFLPPP